LNRRPIPVVAAMFSIAKHANNYVFYVTLIDKTKNEIRFSIDTPCYTQLED